MKLDLDYAKNANASPAWVWWLFAAGLLSLAATSGQYSRLKSMHSGLSLQLEARTTAKKAPVAAPLSSEAETALKDQAKKANAVLAELGRPWPMLFARLESAAGKDVALLAIRPEADKGRVRLTGEARNLADVLEYIDRLAKAEMADVVLESHEVVEADPQKPVRFALTANWSR